MTADIPDGAVRVTVVTATSADGQRVGLAGRLDVHTVPDLRLELHRVIASADGPLMIDLCDAEIGDATALGMLVECHHRCRRAGRAMTFENACDRGQRLLRAVRLHQTRVSQPVG